MLKVQTANSTYIFTRVGGPLLKVGTGQPPIWALNPIIAGWVEVPNVVDRVERPSALSHHGWEWCNNYPVVGERWEVTGKGERLNTSPVVQVTDYSQWCRRIDQPTYHLCTEHVFALAKNNDVRLSTSCHTDGDCDLCVAAHDDYERTMDDVVDTITSRIKESVPNWSRPVEADLL